MKYHIMASVRLELRLARRHCILHRIEHAQQPIPLLLLTEVIRDHVVVLRHEGPPLIDGGQHILVS